jgi:hypothetical protein
LKALYRKTRKGHKTWYLYGKKCATPPMAEIQPPFIAEPLEGIARPLENKK